MKINSKKDFVLFLRKEKSFIKENLKTIKLMGKDENIGRMDIASMKVIFKMANLLDKDKALNIMRMEKRSMKVSSKMAN